MPSVPRGSIAWFRQSTSPQLRPLWTRESRSPRKVARSGLSWRSRIRGTRKSCDDGPNNTTLRCWRLLMPLEALQGPTDWSSRRHRSDRPWVLPNLEHCFLRHVSGLRTLRDLLEQAEAGSLGDGVICCDSWAWAYLQAIWPIPESEAVTLQAFDGSRFARLLMDMVTTRSQRTIHFRNASTGKDVLSVPSADVVVTEEMAELVARCRGNVGLALSHWRERLRTEPESEAKVDGKNAREHVHDSEAAEDENVWVSAFRELPLPVDTDEDIALILHALLLHNGLPAVMLSETLPLSRERSVELLFRLRETGFVKECSGRWFVVEAAYVAVRTFLSGRGYLVDGF